jgi:thymidylate synthase (FAD)
MPKNNNLKPKQFPQVIRFNEEPSTEFCNNLASIKVQLLNAPSLKELKEYLPGFVKATWIDHPALLDDMSSLDRDRIVRQVFFGKTLPTAQETIGLVWFIDGISIQEVTHILRYRGASFSADCSADKWWTHKRGLVPNAIEESPEFYARYMSLVEETKKLYCDMIDSREISILDARYILPRCLETFYYMRMNLKDTLHFIQQRIDKQIQPETDNIIAYQMYLELLGNYPIANGLIDIHKPAMHYISQARSDDSSNIYPPDKDSDIFEWNEKDFLYSKTRDKMNGTSSNAYNHFNVYLEGVEAKIKLIERSNIAYLGYDPKELD